MERALSFVPLFLHQILGMFCCVASASHPNKPLWSASWRHLPEPLHGHLVPWAWQAPGFRCGLYSVHWSSGRKSSWESSMYHLSGLLLWGWRVGNTLACVTAGNAHWQLPFSSRVWNLQKENYDHPLKGINEILSAGQGRAPALCTKFTGRGQQRVG